MGVAERVPVNEHASESPSNVVRIVETDASDPFER
jgi:hypothetical protein